MCFDWITLIALKCLAFRNCQLRIEQKILLAQSSTTRMKSKLLNSEMKFTKRPPDVAMKKAQFFRWIPPDLGPKWLQVWPSTVTLKDPEKGELDIVSDGGWRDLVVPCHQLWDVDPNQLKPCMCRKGKSIFDGLNGKNQVWNPYGDDKAGHHLW